MRGPLLRYAGVTTEVTEKDRAAWSALQDEVAAIGTPAGAKSVLDHRVGPCQGESGQSLEIAQSFEVADETATRSYYSETLGRRGWAISTNPNADLYARKLLAGVEVRFFLDSQPVVVDVSYSGSGSSSCGARL